MRLLVFLFVCHSVRGQREEQNGASAVGLRKLRLVYEWKQITYNTPRGPLLQDRFGYNAEDENAQQAPRNPFPDRATHQNSPSNGPIWRQNSPNRPYSQQNGPTGQQNGPLWQQTGRDTRRDGRYGNTKAHSPSNDRVVFRENATEADSDFQRIPSTLNYVDLNVDKSKSPALRPYSAAATLVSVYRTRADQCDRLWAVDTGLLEIPDARRQVQPPAIVIFDLKTDREIHRYQLKQSDLVSDRTPAGLASIVVDVEPGRCDAAFAYVADLTTYGIVVYSLGDNDSWRVNHNFFSFNPLVGKLNVAGQEFSWNDGIFSIALGARQADGYRTAYFHPMVSLEEFAVSTRVLRNRTLATREFHGEDFKLLGTRGARSQSTAHARHERSDALLFAEIGRDAVSCWNTRRPLTPDNKVTLAQDPDLLVYPSDIHITGDTVWVMSNQMPRFIYSRLDPNQYNFRVFSGDVNEMIRGTACEPPDGLDHTRPVRPAYSG